jgi:alpha-glucosidase
VRYHGNDDELQLNFNFHFLEQPWIAERFRAVVEEWERLLPKTAWPDYTLSNHDRSRAASCYGLQRAGVAAVMLLTLRGTPFIYYGEEIGMTGAKPDERIRTPMRWDGSTPAAGFSTHAPWESLSGDPASVNVATESADPGSLLSHYRDLVRLRAAHPALATGTWTAVVADAPGVVAALRVSPTETALVLTNVGTSAASPALTLSAGPLCGSPAAAVAFGAGPAAAPTITASGGFAGYHPVATIPARSSVVIVLGQ